MTPSLPVVADDCIMPEAMEADQMFVLMTAQYRVSRNTRAQWFFSQVKKVAETSSKEKLVCCPGQGPVTGVPVLSPLFHL